MTRTADGIRAGEPNHYLIGHHPRPRNYPKVSCAVCGKRFEIKPSWVNPDGNYCSRDCSNSRTRQRIGQVCVICGANYELRPSEVGKVKTCGSECGTIRRARTLADKKPTSLERAGYALLDSLGVVYHRQHLIAGKFCVDAHVPEANLIVQFDGDYWHGYPDRFPEPDERQRKRMQQDRKEAAYFAKCGLGLVRFWEHEVLKDPGAVAARLRLEIGC